MKLNRVAMPLLVCIFAFACIMICNTDSVHADSYDVWVKGVQVTDENMNNVLGDDNETVKFQAMLDLETGTMIYRLILNNADIQATGSGDLHNDAVIYSGVPLTVRLAGENKVGFTAGDIDRGKTIRGIWSVWETRMENLAADGEQGSLDVNMKLTNGSINNPDEKRFELIWIGGTDSSQQIRGLELDNVKLALDGNGGHKITGVGLNHGDVNIKNGADFSCKIWTKHRAVGIDFGNTTKRELNVVNSKATFDVVGAAEGPDSGTISAVYSLWNFILNVSDGSEFQASAKDYSELFDKYAVTLNMANSSGSGAINVSEDSNFVLKSGKILTTCNIDRSSYETKDTIVCNEMSGENRYAISNNANIANNNTYRYLTFGEMKVWDIWVSGIRVTEMNFRNILNDSNNYSVVYHPSSNTLQIGKPGEKLKATRIGDNDFATAIYATGEQADLNIALVYGAGDNRIYPSDGTLDGVSTEYGIYTTGNLTIAPKDKYGDKKGLTVDIDRGTEEYDEKTGIKAGGDITIEDAAVVVRVEDGSGNNTGIQAGGKLSLNYKPVDNYSESDFAGAQVFGIAGEGKEGKAVVAESISVSGLALLEAQGTTTTLSCDPDISGHDIGGAFVNDGTDRLMDVEHIWNGETNLSEYKWVRIPQYKKYEESAEPTCEEDGYIAHWRDNATDTYYKMGTGGEIGDEISKASVIQSKLGHDWGESTYEWNEDNSKCTASHTCQRDGCGVTKTEEVETTSEVTRQAACLLSELTTWTSKEFKDEKFGVQKKTEETARPLGHDWSEPEYEWADDNSKCTGSHKCQREGCGLEEEEKVDATFELTQKATCELPELTTWTTGEFDVAEFEVQVKVVETMEALGHDYPDEWTVASDKYHKRECRNDKSHVIREEHNWDDGTVTKEPTCETEGEKIYVCQECRWEKNETIDPLGHDFSEEVPNTAKDATCTEAGKESDKKCSHCEEIQEGAEIPALGHDWTEWKQTKAPTTTAEGEEARQCSRCDVSETRPVKKLEPTPEPGKDAPTQRGSDGTAFGPGASIEVAEAAMATANMDGDPAGTKFAPLYLKSTKTTKKSAKVTWNKVSGAQKYILYGNKCGKKNKIKKIKEFGGSSKAFNVKKAAGKKLKAKTAYKFVLVAVDSGNNVICTSKVVHVMTKGGKFGNYSKVKITAPKKAKKGKLTVNVGKSAKIKGKAYKIVGGKKVKIHSKLMYESTNPTIATISKKTGKLKAIKKGTVRINIFAQNGVYKQVKVTVK